MAIYVRYDSVFINSEVVEQLVNWFDILPTCSMAEYPFVQVNFNSMMDYKLPQKSCNPRFPYLPLRHSHGLAA